MPTTSYPDQCKCFSCLKLFSDWEPGDDPWGCHCTNSPGCAFVCCALEAERGFDGTTLASNSAAKLRVDSAEIGSDTISLCDLSSADVTAILPAQSASLLSANTGFETAHFAAAEGDGSNVIVSRVRAGSKSKTDRRKSTRVIEDTTPNDEHDRAQQDLLQIRFLVASSRHAAQQYWDQVAADVKNRVDHVSMRLNGVSERVSRLRDHDWLCGKRGELHSLQDQICRLKAERSHLEAGNTALSAKLEQSRDAASKLRELRVEVSELEHRKALAIDSCRQLEDQIAACLTRIEVSCSRQNDFFWDDCVQFIFQAASSEADALLRDGRQEQEQLVARNKLLQSEISNCNETVHELNHTIARRRQELQVYEVKLKDWSRREEIALDVRLGRVLYSALV